MVKKAIITLDIINEICDPKGKMAGYADRIAKHHIIQNINKITHWGREHSHLIIHVRLGFHSHYLDSSATSPIFSKAQPNQAFLIDKWGGQFCETLEIQPNDIQIVKHRVNAFYGTDLEPILRANRIEGMIITGVSTSNAVELTARDAHDRDFVIQIVEDATECADDQEKKSSLNFLKRITQILPTCQLIQ